MEEIIDEDDTIETKKYICEKCKKKHLCQRCLKNIHICFYCGKLTHICDICGTKTDSLSELKIHQRTSKICKKVKTLTFSSFEEQITKFDFKMITQHHRRKSLN